jgi:L-glutamine-phosphate cytidylyltransferase
MIGDQSRPRAIILAAGRGSRLHTYTKDRPKCLVELGGQTLIGRQLATLRNAGIGDIVIATGYRAEMLSLPGTRQIHNPLWENTNMVESLFCAEAEFGHDAIVSYGDIVYEPRVLAALLDSPHEISIVVDRDWRSYWEHRFEDPLGDAESLRMNADGCITDVGNEVADIDEIQAQYMGLMRFTNGGVDALRAARAGLGTRPRPWMAKRPVAGAYMTDLLMELILSGSMVHAVPVAGGWLEIDTITDYKRAVAIMADGTISRFFNPNASPALG